MRSHSRTKSNQLYNHQQSPRRPDLLIRWSDFITDRRTVWNFDVENTGDRLNVKDVRHSLVISACLLDKRDAYDGPQVSSITIWYMLVIDTFGLFDPRAKRIKVSRASVERFNYWLLRKFNFVLYIRYRL